MALTAIDWEPLISRTLSELSPGRELGGGNLRRAGLLLEHVTEWNARMDLTAARSPEELVDLFFADAAILAAASSHEGAAQTSRWVDVGSGAGAPAIPLALMLPGIEVTLVEPRQKRVAFLRSALGRIERSDIAVLRSRSDALADGDYDVALSRATLPPEAWLREGTRLARRAVWVLLASGSPPSIAGWSADIDRSYRLPASGAPRRALRYVPRSAG